MKSISCTSVMVPAVTVSGALAEFKWVLFVAGLQMAAPPPIGTKESARTVYPTAPAAGPMYVTAPPEKTPTFGLLGETINVYGSQFVPVTIIEPQELVVLLSTEMLVVEPGKTGIATCRVAPPLTVTCC